MRPSAITRLGLVGWVRNEPDGSAAHFEDGEEDVDAILEWFGRGSLAAEMEDVEVREVEPTGASWFEVKH